jgi:hypothetical protein
MRERAGRPLLHASFGFKSGKVSFKAGYLNLPMAKARGF